MLWAAGEFPPLASPNLEDALLFLSRATGRPISACTHGKIVRQAFKFESDAVLHLPRRSRTQRLQASLAISAVDLAAAQRWRVMGAAQTYLNVCFSAERAALFVCPCSLLTDPYSLAAPATGQPGLGVVDQRGLRGGTV